MCYGRGKAKFHEVERLHAKFHVNVFIVGFRWPKTTILGKFWHFWGSCTDPLLPMRVKFGVLQQARGPHWRAKFHLNVFIVGPRNNCSCSPIITSKSTVLSWVSERRYLGIYIKRFTNFKCSIDHPKRPFYLSANAIFDRVGRISSEDITLQLINTVASAVKELWKSVKMSPS